MATACCWSWQLHAAGHGHCMLLVMATACCWSWPLHAVGHGHLMLLVMAAACSWSWPLHASGLGHCMLLIMAIACCWPWPLHAAGMATACCWSWPMDNVMPLLLSGRIGCVVASGLWYLVRIPSETLWFMGRIWILQVALGGYFLYIFWGNGLSIDLPSLTPLSVAGCGRLRVLAAHGDTSVASLQVVKFGK